MLNLMYLYLLLLFFLVFNVNLISSKIRKISNTGFTQILIPLYDTNSYEYENINH